MKFFKKGHCRKIVRKFTLVKPPLSVPQAQLTKALRFKEFISENERRQLLTILQNCNFPSYTSNVNEDIDTLGNPVHTTMYVQTDNFFETKLDWLHKRIVKLVRHLNIKERWGFNMSSDSSFNVRVAEYHEMSEGGSLSDCRHVDVGSVVTVDIMLEEATKGAIFQTLESTKKTVDELKHIHHTGHEKSEEINKEKEFLKPHSFCARDAMVFMSHKYHCVSTLLKGQRKVFVVEFWNGQKPICGHRCEDPTGNCTFIPEE